MRERPRPAPDAPPYQKRYRSLTEPPGPDRPPCVTLHDDLTVCEGDRFIDLDGPNGPHTLTVDDVLEEIPVGWDGEPIDGLENTAFVVCTTDDPYQNEHAVAGRLLRINEATFIEHVREETYIPHAGNDFVPQELRK